MGVTESFLFLPPLPPLLPVTDAFTISMLHVRLFRMFLSMYAPLIPPPLPPTPHLPVTDAFTISMLRLFRMSLSVYARSLLSKLDRISLASTSVIRTTSLSSGNRRAMSWDWLIG